MSALDESDQTRGDPVLKFVRSEGRRWHVADGKGQGGGRYSASKRFKERFKRIEEMRNVRTDERENTLK